MTSDILGCTQKIFTNVAWADSNILLEQTTLHKQYATSAAKCPFPTHNLQVCITEEELESTLIPEINLLYALHLSLPLVLQFPEQQSKLTPFDGQGPAAVPLGVHAAVSCLVGVLVGFLLGL